jgi:hypothetical protein
VSDLWIPGASAPLDDLVARIHLRVEAFVERTGAEPVVEVELRDGSTIPVRSLSAEPGFGFVALAPHGENGGEEEWIVPVAAVARIRLRTGEKEEPFGFAVSATPKPPPRSG